MTRDSVVPRVGISRCLMGDAVRHDGGHRRDEPLLSALCRFVEWVPVCPEVEVGMGTPREPLQLVERTDGAEGRRVRLVGVAGGEDWTERMTAWARAQVSALAALKLSGFVLKSRSPSCGLHDVPVATRDGRVRGLPGRGLFAEVLASTMPGLPVEDELGLRDVRVRQRFLEQVRRYQGRYA